MTLRYELLLGATFVLSAGLSCAACSSGSENSKRTPSTSGSFTGGSGASSGSGSSASGSGIDLKPPDLSTGVDPADKRDLPVREKSCDESGANCTCLRLALLGSLDSAANNKDTKPFIDWLNNASDGTATVTMVSKKPTLDSAFLDQYDILLIANVNTWSFNASEKSAVEQWVREKGGGIVALSGFESTPEEAAATSSLIGFSGIHFQEPKTAENGQAKPVYYKDGTVDLKNCLAWNGSSEAIITTPIRFTPQSDTLAKLTYSLDYVGAFVGWGVSAPPGATVVAKDPVSGSNIAVALEFEGKGRIFAFGDEWVIFANQWAPPATATPNNLQKDQYNPCWSPPSGNAEGFFHSVKTLYQTKQFWYDAINWVAPPNECSFVVKDEEVVPILR